MRIGAKGIEARIDFQIYETHIVSAECLPEPIEGLGFAAQPGVDQSNLIAANVFLPDERAQAIVCSAAATSPARA